jgi:hypothetical protein
MSNPVLPPIPRASGDAAADALVAERTKTIIAATVGLVGITICGVKWYQAAQRAQRCEYAIERGSGRRAPRVVPTLDTYY